MKKLATLLLSATLLSSSVSFAEDSKVVATYKGGEIKESEVINQFKDVLAQDPNLKDKKFEELDSKIREALIKGYLNTKLLSLEAKNSQIESTKEFQEKLSEIKERLLQQQIIENYLKKNITEAMIDSEYNKLVQSMKGKDEVKASHILLDNEDKAKEAKKKLSKGAKFEDVVKEFSTDKSSSASGGSLGYFTEGQFVPEFEKKAFAMKVGEISDPVKTQFGWHIIKIEDRRKIKVPTKDEAKQGILMKLNKELMEKFFADLDKKYDAKLN